MLLLLLACTTDPGPPAGGVAQDTGCPGSSWYVDGDQDGYGAGTAVVGCEAPVGRVDNALDCDDGDASVSPAAAESCDGIDNDCDGVVDPSTSVDAVECYLDSDGDGFGNDDQVVFSCACTGGLSAKGGDCLDSDSSVYPGATEIWYDSVDSDCAGDDDFDADGDGFRSEDAYKGTDCLDSDPNVNPDAYDLCDNGLDDDCDGLEPGCGLDGRVDSDGVDNGREGSFLNSAFAFAGDSDGDGRPEVLVGLSDVGSDGSTTHSEAWLLELRAPAVGDEVQVPMDDLVQARFILPSADDGGVYGVNYGNAFLANIDFDGDGTLDYMLGASGSAYVPRSRIDLWLGPVSAEMSLEDALTFPPDGTDLEIGHDLALLVPPGGPDPWQVAAGVLVVKSVPSDADVAATYLLGPAQFDGTAGLDDAVAIWPTGCEWCETGRGLVTGDVDGDGVRDLMFSHGLSGFEDGIETFTSTTLIFLGPFDADRTTDDADVVIDESDLSPHSGIAWIPGGFNHLIIEDADGEDGGVSRVVLGNPWSEPVGDEYAGSVHIFEWDGSAALWGPDDASVVLRGVPGSDTAALPMSYGGDLDRDGVAELVVPAGNPDGIDDSRGGVYIVELPASGTVDLLSDSDVVIESSDSTGELNFPVVSGHDLDGDGIDDLLIGDFYWDTTATGLGRALMFRGGTGGF
ncbi:MAG: hypothetical protein GXP62_15570 [Oligoflexia bacterium]|nr:hypothetical protein [Oligoflexia bacterium]